MASLEKDKAPQHRSTAARHAAFGAFTKRAADECCIIAVEDR